MIRLIIARHGETDWNKDRLIQGKTDIPLNDKGIMQAKSLAAYLQDHYPLDFIYASPLRRALETAKYCAEAQGLAVEIDEGLREISFGDWEGKTFIEIGKIHPKELDDWENAPANCKVPGDSESVQDVFDRSVAFVKKIKPKHEGQTVLLLSHHVPSKMIIAEALGLSLEQMHNIKLENCGINVLDVFSERSVLRRLNEMPYYDAEQMKGDGW